MVVSVKSILPVDISGEGTITDFSAGGWANTSQFTRGISSQCCPQYTQIPIKESNIRQVMSLAICSPVELSKGARCLFLASTGEEDTVGMEMLADFSTSPKLLPSKRM